jgi:hypothetical protein
MRRPSAAREQREVRSPLRAGQRGGSVRGPGAHHAGHVTRTPIGALRGACAWRGPATRLVLPAVGRKPAKTQRPTATVSALRARIWAVNRRPARQQLQGGKWGESGVLDAGAHRDFTVSADTDKTWPDRSASASSAAACSRRSAARSSSTEESGDPASPIRARAAVRRLTIRSEPPLSSLIVTSSPGFRPSRFRKSAGRTSRPRSSSLVFPLRRLMWEIIPSAHAWISVGSAAPCLPCP